MKSTNPGLQVYESLGFSKNKVIYMKFRIQIKDNCLFQHGGEITMLQAYNIDCKGKREQLV